MTPATATDAEALAALEPPRTELVLGIVATVGTDLDHFQEILLDHVKQFDYEPKVIRLTDFFKHLDLASEGLPTEHANYCERIKLRMDAGNHLRRQAERGDILALHAAAAIHADRKKNVAAQPPQDEANALRALEISALKRTAYIVRSLKHVDEVKTLRRIYGSSFLPGGAVCDQARTQGFPHRRTKGV